MSAAVATRPPSRAPEPPAPGPQMGDPVTGAALVVSRVITGLLVVGPAVALGIALLPLWGHVIGLRDVFIAVAFYLVSAFGVTVGFHRLFTHRSFTANRPLKVVLAAAGSLAVEGSPIAWVANHRRHHMFSDHPGDPHSPHGFGRGVANQLRGLLHAHCGWVFKPDFTPAERFAPDLLGDRDIRVVNRLFPVLAIVSFALPFGIGWALSGTVAGAVTALLWAGLIRMALLHHVTWSINSVCHMFGKRPCETKDRSTNVSALAILSLGESWHNFHHAHPSSARHGAFPHQVDLSAGLIRVFERLGWATSVRWPAAPSIA